MFIPLGTDRYKRRPIVVTYVLIALNLGAFAATELLLKNNPDLARRWLTWTTLAPGSSGWWTYLSYAFLHANYSHIIFNMLALWVFGPDVEDRLGRIGFGLLYLAGAAGAGGAQALLDKSPVVGASGAIAATIGAFLVFFPYVRVRTLVFFIIVGMFHITAWWYIAFAIAMDLFGMARGGGNTAYLAHLGGYALGSGVSLLLLAFKIVPREPYDLFTIGRQAARRRAFKAAHAAARPAPVERKTREPEVKRPDGPAARARLRAQEQLSAGDPAGAAAAYLEMRGEPDGAKLPPLGRRQLYEIANHLFEVGDHPNAADAYRQLLNAYATDPEAPRVLLMLGLINARFLNDPTEAKRSLLACRDKLAGEDERALAKDLLEEIG